MTEQATRLAKVSTLLARYLYRQATGNDTDVVADESTVSSYRKIPKFSDARKLCCNLPKTQTKRQNLRVFHQKDANGIANSEDPDQTAPLHCLTRTSCPKN